MDEHVPIGAVSRRLGIDPDTLRYYERRGITPQPDRDASGRRSYSPGLSHLLEVLTHLKETGMPLAQIAEFTRHVARDPAGVPERLALLREHRQRVVERIQRWESSLSVVDRKIEDYAGRCHGASVPPPPRTAEDRSR